MPGVRTRPIVAGTVFVSLAITVGVVWLLLPFHTEEPSLHLKLTRRSTVQGKPLFVFRVEGSRRRTQIWGVQLIKGDHREDWPFEEINSSRNEFGVFAPPGGAFWQLAAVVEMESPSQSVRFHQMAHLWTSLRMRGSSIYEATRQSLHTFYIAEAKVVISDLITNNVPLK